MYEYDDEVLDTFLKKQTQLFSEEVADTPEAAEEFLEAVSYTHLDVYKRQVYNGDAKAGISGVFR